MAHARYARTSTVNQDPIPDNVFRGDEHYASGYSNYPAIWDLDVPENPLRHESPAVRDVAIHLTARRNWGTFKGVGKNWLRFRQRPIAAFLKLPLSTFRRALARCYELMIFHKPLGYVARSRVEQTVIVLAEQWVKACKSGRESVKPKPSAASEAKTQERESVKSAPYIEGRNSQKQTTPTPSGGGADRLPREEFLARRRFDILKSRCRKVIERLGRVIYDLTPDNIDEHLSPDDSEILGVAWKNVGVIRAEAIKVESDPKIRDPLALLSYRLAAVLDRYGLTIQDGRLTRRVA